MRERGRGRRRGPVCWQGGRGKQSTQSEEGERKERAEEGGPRDRRGAIIPFSRALVQNRMPDLLRRMEGPRISSSSFHTKQPFTEEAERQHDPPSSKEGRTWRPCREGVWSRAQRPRRGPQPTLAAWQFHKPFERFGFLDSSLLSEPPGSAECEAGGRRRERALQQTRALATTSPSGASRAVRRKNMGLIVASLVHGLR